MSDEPLVDYQSAQEEGQPSGQPDGVQPKYVTEDSIDAKIADAVVRELQRQTDRDDTRIEKKLTKWIEKMERRGIKVTDALKARGREEIALAELRNLPDEDEAAQPIQDTSRSQSRSIGSLPPGMDQATIVQNKARLDARIAELENELGVKMDDDAARLVNWDFSNPVDNVIAEAEKALRFKAWEAGQGGPKIAPNAGRMPAPGGAPGTGMVDAMTNELIALQDKRGRTQADERRMKELEVEILKHVPRA